MGAEPFGFCKGAGFDFAADSLAALLRKALFRSSPLIGIYSLSPGCRIALAGRLVRIPGGQAVSWSTRH